MKCRFAVAVAAAAILTAGASGWTQLPPDASPKLAPTLNPKHPTSVESLNAYAQDLTKKIKEAQAQGKDTSVAETERLDAEKSMQHGDQEGALRHFEAGEKVLQSSPSQP